MSIGWVWLQRGVLAGLLLGLLAVFGLFEGWERLSYDARSFVCARFCPPVAAAPVTVVVIDNRALDYAGRWPWPRKTLAALVRQIRQAGATVVGLDVILSEPAAGDAELAAAFSAGRVVLPVYHDGERQVLPVPALRTQATLGHIEVQVDSDGVVRSVPTVRHGYMAFSSVAVGMFTGQIPASTADRLWLNMRPARDVTKLALTGLIDTISAADVLQGSVPKRLLQGRLVLVGMGATGVAGLDAHLTPLRPLGAIPGVYIHASLAAAEINGLQMHRSGRFWNLLLALAAGLAAGILLALPAPTRGRDTAAVMLQRLPAAAVSLLALGVAGLYALAVFVAQWRYHLWLPWVAPVFTLLGTVLWAQAEKRVLLEQERQGLRRLFTRYVPVEVMPELLRHSNELGLAGVQRDVAVLFADVRGFTALAEPLAPVQVMQVLNLYLEALAASVRQHGGMVDKYLGDGLMAVFGAPVPHKNAVQAAVDCAVDMHVRVSALVVPPCLAQLPPIGVGVHVGEAVLGTVGGKERLEYTAMGDVVNVAARLEEMAPAGSILLSGDVVKRLAGEPVQRFCVPLGARQVRGKREQVEVFEIRCNAANDTKFPDDLTKDGAM